MILNTKIRLKRYAVEIICLLYILLFVYAAVTKLLDFENFQVQLGQSPLLSVFAGWVSWLVPIVELIIALLLIVQKSKAAGLLMALSLMTMFTAYIYIILNYSSFVPCSCGGILEKMSWRVHLIFNIIFVILGAIGFSLNRSFENKNISHKSSFRIIIASVLLSSAVMILLFSSSEDIMHNENPFIRRYPKHPIILDKSLDLQFNSFYFAGYSKDRIYLGNVSNPLHILSFNATLGDRRDNRIGFLRKDIPFRMIRISIKDSRFYIMDGSVPCIFRGNVSDWKINRELTGSPKFTLAVPLDSSNIAFRFHKGKNASHVLGVFQYGDPSKIIYNDKLLRKQVDGIFDTDGILMGSEKDQKLVYLYYYRNQFVTADKNGNFVNEGHTIDTISTAQINVAHLKGRNERKMASPPLVVNDLAVVCGNLLFVKSKIHGRFEKEELWEQAAIIDVYNFEKNSYLMSFAIYEIGNKKLQSFYVTPTHVYAIIGNELVVYEIGDNLKKEMNNVRM